MWPSISSSLALFRLIGAEYAVVFNNAMLPDLASPGKLGKLSGYGWAMGYIGALLALPIMLWITGQLPGVTGPELDHTARVGDRLAYGAFHCGLVSFVCAAFRLRTPDTSVA